MIEISRYSVAAFLSAFPTKKKPQEQLLRSLLLRFRISQVSQRLIACFAAFVPIKTQAQRDIFLLPALLSISPRLINLPR